LDKFGHILYGLAVAEKVDNVGRRVLILMFKRWRTLGTQIAFFKLPTHFNTLFYAYNDKIYLSVTNGGGGGKGKNLLRFMEGFNLQSFRREVLFYRHLECQKKKQIKF
jgi:hypothetical protein